MMKKIKGSEYRTFSRFWRVQFLSGVSLMVLVGALALPVAPSHAQDGTQLDISAIGFQAIDAAAMPNPADDIYLDVTVNGEGRPEMFSFRQLPDGTLTMHADELRAVGILPVKSATDKDGWVNLAQLPNVSYVIRDDNIVDFVTTDEAALAPYTTSLSSWATPSNFRSREQFLTVFMPIRAVIVLAP